MHLPMQLRYWWTGISPKQKKEKVLVQPNFKFAHAFCSISNQFDSIFSQVDPIVASFSGGAVGVISALMLIEANNVEQQEKKRCKYCHGSGMYQCTLVYVCACYSNFAFFHLRNKFGFSFTVHCQHLLWNNWKLWPSNETYRNFI